MPIDSPSSDTAAAVLTEETPLSSPLFQCNNNETTPTDKASSSSTGYCRICHEGQPMVNFPCQLHRTLKKIKIKNKLRLHSLRQQVKFRVIVLISFVKVPEPISDFIRTSSLLDRTTKITLYAVIIDCKFQCIGIFLALTSLNINLLFRKIKISGSKVKNVLLGIY